jgi:transcription elongation factor Elf1
MSQEFACPNCRRQSVVYADAAEDDARVVCRTCGTFLGMLTQLRRFLERRAPGPNVQTSGC